MAITMQRTTLSKVVLTYYDRKFIERVESNRILVFRQFGDVKTLPKREGDKVTWTRWNAFTRGKLITESGSGQARGMSVTQVSAQIMQIGDHTKITTLLDLVSINSVVDGAIELFADAAAWSLDFIASRQLLWVRTATSAQYAAASISGAVGANNKSLSASFWRSGENRATSSTIWQAPVFLVDDLGSTAHLLSALKGTTSATLLTPRIIRALRLKFTVKMALPFEDGYYKAIVHPDLVHQLRGSSAFIDLHKYTESGLELWKTGKLQEGKAGYNRENGLVGILEGFKFYESTEVPWANLSMVKSSAHGGGRAYFSFFFGKHAYGVTDFAGGLQTIIKTPGPGDTSNPLNLFSTVGYKAISTHKVLNKSCCLWLISGKPTVTG